MKRSQIHVTILRNAVGMLRLNEQHSPAVIKGLEDVGIPESWSVSSLIHTTNVTLE
jgi:hypothetical protein